MKALKKLGKEDYCEIFFYPQQFPTVLDLLNTSIYAIMKKGIYQFCKSSNNFNSFRSYTSYYIHSMIVLIEAFITQPAVF